MDGGRFEISRRKKDRLVQYLPSRAAGLLKMGRRQFQTAEDRAVNDGGKNVRDKEHMTMLPNWKVFCWTYEGEIRVEEEGCQTAASLQLISPQTATLT